MTREMRKRLVLVFMVMATMYVGKGYSGEVVSPSIEKLAAEEAGGGDRVIGLETSRGDLIRASQIRNLGNARNLVVKDVKQKSVLVLNSGKRILVENIEYFYVRPEQGQVIQKFSQGKAPNTDEGAAGGN